MTDLGHEARLVLHEWARRPDPDPYQRQWKALYLEAMIEAATRTGLLGGDELAAWRTVTGHDSWPAPPVDRLRVHAHLEELLAPVMPLTREPDQEGLAASERFNNALKTLHVSGLLSVEDHAEWQARALRAQAPWLDDGDVTAIGTMSGAVAISIPPSTEEEALQDAAALEQTEPVGTDLVRACPVRLVQRVDGTAVTAVALRSGCVDVHFHHVGPPLGDAGGEHPGAFRAALQALPPPHVADDLGTLYVSHADGPTSAQGFGGPDHPQRPSVITGVWRYAPAVPPEATALTIGTGDAQTRLDLSLCV